MTKILITGVAGLIGSRFAQWILSNKKEVEVIGIDDLSGGYIENLHPKIKFYKKNLAKDNLDEIFEECKPDYVFHFAAYAAEGLSPFIRKFNYESNLISTSSLINQCIKNEVKRLVFTSSLAVYGHGNGHQFDEQDIPSPIDPYGVAKFACEMDIKIAGQQHNLDWCIIRPHNVYGINQNIWDKYRNVIGIWMYQILNSQPITIFGDGLQTRAFSFIDDILEPLWNSALRQEASKQIINLGGIREHSILETATILKEIVGRGEIVFLESRHEVKHSIPTWKKSQDILDFSHKTNLREGIKQMWEWAKAQPMRERFVWEKYELDKDIYNFWKN